MPDMCVPEQKVCENFLQCLFKIIQVKFVQIRQIQIFKKIFFLWYDIIIYDFRVFFCQRCPGVGFGLSWKKMINTGQNAQINQKAQSGGVQQQNQHTQKVFEDHIPSFCYLFDDLNICVIYNL